MDVGFFLLCIIRLLPFFCIFAAQMVSGLNINYRRWAALLMLWLFISHIASISLFSHRHTIEGETFYHSHLYNGTTDSPNHSHSTQQLKVISALEVYIALAASTITSQSAPAPQLISIIGNKDYTPISSTCSVTSLRAPPYFI